MEGMTILLQLVTIPLPLVISTGIDTPFTTSLVCEGHSKPNLSMFCTFFQDYQLFLKKQCKHPKVKCLRNSKLVESFNRQRAFQLFIYLLIKIAYCMFLIYRAYKNVKIIFEFFRQFTLRRHNWMHFAHRPQCIVTLNSN